MAGRTPPEDTSRPLQPLRGPFSEPRSQRWSARQYPSSLDTDLSLAAELRRSEEQTGQRSLPNNLVIFSFIVVVWVLSLKQGCAQVPEAWDFPSVTTSVIPGYFLLAYTQQLEILVAAVLLSWQLL